MTAQNLRDDESFDFALQKEIDAACDRLEDDRNAGRTACIETYLKLIDPAKRKRYFSKLLWTDLTLTTPVDWQLIEQQYLRRFPEYRSIVTAVIKEVRTASKLEPDVESGAHVWEIVGFVQQRMRRAAAASVGESTQIDEGGVPMPFPPSESTAAELWQLLLRHSKSITPANELSRQRQADQLEAVLGAFLTAFSDVRRHVLTSILLGSTPSQAATQHRLTQRTVDVTCRVAKSLLST